MKRIINRALFSLVLFFCLSGSVAGQAFSFSCHGGYLTGADCQICTGTTTARLFNGLIIRRGVDVFRLIDCPYTVRVQGNNLIFQELIFPNPETVTISLISSGYSTLTGFKDSTACMCAQQDSVWGGDPSITNEGILGVGAGASNTSVITSNTSTAVGVTITAAGINTISETTSSNGGNITITGTEVDGSTTNELQTIANTFDATSHTVTLSNSGGSVQIIEGTGIGLSTGGTGLDGTTTITNTAPDQTVSITGAGISVVTGTYPNFTVTSTEVDGSVTNEGSQTVGAGGANTSTIVSNTSGSTPVTVSGSNTILVTESGSTITLQADTSLLATVNDLNTRLIVDTVNDYTALRAYSSTAPIVFVRKNGIHGFFKVVTGGWVDDGGITIVGMKKFRRITENLRIVNVRWFGAVADSTTDDNTAIQAALNWCLDSVAGIGTTLYFPAGKYRYTSQIYAYKPKNIAIAGDGMHNTYLFPVNVNGIYFRADSTAIVGSGVYGNTEMRDFSIRDLTMIRSGSNSFASKLIGIYLRGGINMRVERVRVEEFFATSGGGIGSMGIKLDVSTTLTNDVTQHTTLSDVWVSQCDTGIVTHLNNTMLWHNVQVDQCKDFGVVLGNGVFWNEGMIQGCENGGLWLQKNSSDVISNVHVNHVYFEQNSYVSPKYGFVYKADNTDATNVVFQNCGFSSSANTRIFNLKRITAGAFVNNKYLVSSTDTIWLQSMSNIQFGNDNYESATLITSDCNITWLNGVSGSVNSVTGLSLSTPEPGPNVLNVNAGVAVGPTYYNITAPTSGAIIEGDVGIKNSSPTQALHVTGNARVTGAFYDSNNQAGTSGQVLSSTLTGTDWITNTSGGGPDSTWAKSVGGGYANKRITDPVYRSSAVRVNMAADSAALTLKYHSAQTAAILDIERNDGTTVAYAHVYNETGSNPSLVFGKAGTVSASSSNNTVFGLTSGLFSAGAGDNTLIGARAGNSLNGGYENTFVGSRAGQSVTSGGQNAGFGYSALQNIQNGGQNMAIGRRALNSLTSASRNTAVGSDALRLVVTTVDNVGIGTQAGDSCVGSNNVYIGSAAGRRSKGSGNILIGYSAGENQGNVSNQLYVENTNSTTPLIGGDFSANRAGINTAPGSLARDFHVTGEVRISDLTTDTPTRIVGADADGDLDDITVSTGLTLSSGNLTADDASATNELQTLASTSDATSHTVTLSTSGGSIQFVEGTGIGLATTGTGLDGILTITNTATGDGSVTNEGILGVSAGGSNDALLISNTSTAVGVTYAGSAGVVITESTSSNGGTITIAMPSGSTNQTLRYTGSAWAASSEIINDDAAVGIGGNPVSGFELYVNGASRNDGAIVTRGTGSNFISALTTPHVRIWNTTATTGDTWYLGSEDDGDFSITSGNLGAIEMIIGNTTGYVGLGSVTPTQKLHVTGNARVTGAYYDSNNDPGTSGQVLSSTVTGTDWISGGSGTLTAANNGLYVSGTTVRMGTNPLIEATLIDQDANDMRFYDGKWSYTSWSTSWTPTQGFGVQGVEASPTTASSPTQDGVMEMRVVSSGGSAQPNSLTVGGYATDADGIWLQSRSHSNPSVEYPLSAQPRGGQFSVGRLTGLDALVTFSSTGLAGSTAAGSVLHLENAEGNQKAAMTVGVAAATDVVDGEFAYFDATDILRVTNRNTTVGTSALRFAVGGETSDRVTIIESSVTPNARMGVGITAPLSTLQSAGSLAASCITFTGALTLDERHYRVEYTGTAAITITLPTAANAANRMYVIHHRGTAGTITLSIAINKGNGTTFNTLTAGQHVFIHSDGTTWNGIKLNSL